MFDRLYAVYDVKAEGLAGPQLFTTPTDGVAGRSFIELLKTPGTVMHQHPQDFNLICLGVVKPDEHGRLSVLPEDGTGVLYGRARVVLLGRDVVNAENNRQTAENLYADLSDERSPKERLAALRAANPELALES